VAANLLYYLADMKYSVRYAWLTEPYMYIVMNVENFAHAVEKIQKFAYGLYSFDFVFALTGLKHTLYEYLHMPKYPYLLTNNYNTYTMFFIYYWDYGVVGLGMIPFVLGTVFSNSYYAMRRKPTINNITMYAIYAFVILFSFFIPIISFLHFAFNYFIIYTVTKILSISKNNGTVSGEAHARL
jgi:oligosaccharide repeat unit polymerase